MYIEIYKIDIPDSMLGKRIYSLLSSWSEPIIIKALPNGRYVLIDGLRRLISASYRNHTHIKAEILPMIESTVRPHVSEIVTPCLMTCQVQGFIEVFLCIDIVDTMLKGTLLRSSKDTRQIGCQDAWYVGHCHKFLGVLELKNT